MTDPAKERVLVILAVLAFWAWMAAAAWAISVRTPSAILITQVLALVTLASAFRVILYWRDW